MPKPAPTSRIVLGLIMSVLCYSFDIVNNIGLRQSQYKVNPVGSSEQILTSDSCALRVAYLKSMPFIGTGVDLYYLHLGITLIKVGLS